MIHVANANDVDLLVALGTKFGEASPYKDYYTEAKIRQIAVLSTTTLMNTNYIAFVDDDKQGMIVGVTTPFILGDVTTATEIAWWVNPEARKTTLGKHLHQAFEEWAKDKGCKLITMISIDDTLGSYYEKCGYKLTERAYMKEI